MNKLVLLFFCIVLISSCRNLLIARYKMNRPFEFTQKEAYMAFLEKERGLLKETIIYPEPDDYWKFRLRETESAIYFGCLINDTTELVKSALVMDNPDCFGRVINEIEAAAKLSGPELDSLVTKSNFSEFRFRYLQNGEPFDLNASGKKLKILLIYFYEVGTYYNPFYKDVFEFARLHKDDIDVFTVTMDNIQQLK